jgi:hypothetical protein
MPIGTLSKSLAIGMTESQVTALREPDRVSVETCGSNTARPWQCKIYKYGLNELWVRFQQTAPNMWQVIYWA